MFPGVADRLGQIRAGGKAWTHFLGRGKRLRFERSAKMR